MSPTALPNQPLTRRRAVANYLAAQIVAHPWLSMLLGFVVLLACAAGAGGYHYSLDHRAFFSSDNPQLAAYEQLNNDYSKTDAVLIAVKPAEGDVFTADTLQALREITEAAWQLPFVQRVESLNNFAHVQVDGDSLNTDDLVPQDAQLSAKQLAEIRDVALNEPFLTRALVADNGQMAAVRLTLNMPGVKPREEIPTFVLALREQVAAAQAQHPTLTFHLAGQTIANQAFPEESQADFVRVWPWFTLTLLAVLWLLFRSLKATLVIYTACQLAVVAGAGLVGWFKPTVNDAVIVAPVMILALALADGIHLVVGWLQAQRRGHDKQAAMFDSLSRNIGPMTTTSVLTALGFLSLHFNDSPPFRVMGYIVACGVLFALLFTVLFSAPLLSRLPGKAPKQVPTLLEGDQRGMARLADVLERHPRWILTAVLLVAGVMLAGLSQNRINDDVVKYYTPGTQFRIDMDAVNAQLTGTSELNYSLKGQGDSGILEPEYLRAVDAYASWLKTQPYVTQVNSLADIIKRVNQVMHGDDPAYYRIPDSREEIAQYLLQYELSLPFGADLNYLLRLDRSAARVRVAVATTSGQALLSLNERAEAWQAQHLPASMQAPGASLSLMFAHIGERSISGMFAGMLASLVLASLAAAWLFGHVRHALTCFVGNLLPIGMAFGAWGWLNGNIDLGLTVVLGIAFSVVIDDTIHFISKYQRECDELQQSASAALRGALKHVGYAILTTSLVLGLGFAWLANSNIQITVNTAIVTCLAIGFALLADLLLIPLMYLWLDRRRSVTSAFSSSRSV
ncbi:hypothetical protein SAMN05216214_11837 [Atopomonas hussainii]|uniref:SSD domain-containing protein n=1 Tax=Atopomonas hussainii TaxID=1429083 RepID=A0A1H7SDC8_9GAMM|nr:MMPL family transporter [Atopomonas hussainii]SEL70309.1 hypothetical protein SAMN05216214_11837 [Atopomonas hussainii]